MTARHQDLAGLLDHAQAQAGVVSLADLKHYGFTTHAVGRRVASGTWHRIGGAIIIPAAAAPMASTTVPTTPHPWAPGPEDYPLPNNWASLIDHQQAWVHQLTFGPTATVSGSLALRMAHWQVPARALVVVTRGKAHASLPGVHLVRRANTTVLRRPDRLRIASAKEAFMDALIAEPAGSRDRVIDAALQQRLVTAEAFGQWIQPRLGPGHKGAGILRTSLERMATGSRSEAEQRMATLLSRSGTGRWIPNHPIMGDRGRVIAEIDFALLDLRIAIEVDGRAHHSDRRSFERDRARQNELTLQGWLVLRFTWEQITNNPGWVIAAVRAAVRQRSAA